MTEEEIATASRKMFKQFHCEVSDPVAIKAFEGCWKIGAVWGKPTDDELKLGMRMSENRAQLFIDSYDATQAANSDKPRYCIAQGIPTVAPYPNADFDEMYTYVYILTDPPDENLLKELQRRYEAFTKDEKIPQKEFEEGMAAWRLLRKKKGKIIRTMIVMGPERVWHDSDEEEDFWAVPAPCDGWEKVEENLKKDMPEAP